MLFNFVSKEMMFIYLGIKSDLIKSMLYTIYIYIYILIQNANIHSPLVTDLSGVEPNNTKKLN